MADVEKKPPQRPAEKRDSQTSPEPAGEKKVERVPENPLLKRKILIVAPFKIWLSEEANPYAPFRKEEKVPATFYIRREQGGVFMEIADRAERPIGWIRTDHTNFVEWNTRVVLRPCPNGKEGLKMYESPADIAAGKPAAVVSNPEIVFPYLGEYVPRSPGEKACYKVGPPLGKTDGSVPSVPMYTLGMTNGEGNVVAEFGVLAKEPELQKGRAVLDLIAHMEDRDWSDSKQSEQIRTAFRMLNSVDWRFLSGEHGMDFDDVDRIREGAESSIPFRPRALKNTVLAISTLGKDDFVGWRQDIERSRDAMDRCIEKLNESGKGDEGPVVQLHEFPGDNPAAIFIRIQELP